MNPSFLLLLILFFSLAGFNTPAGESNTFFIEEYILETPPIIEMPHYKIPLSSDLQKYTWELSQRYDLSYELILAVMKVESNFDIEAISYNDSSLGLMQLNQNTFPWIAEKLDIDNFDAFRPRHNIHAAVWYLDYLRNYWRKYGLTEEELFDAILLSYNRGVAGSKRYMQKYGTEAKYVQTVYDYKTKLEMGEES